MKLSRKGEYALRALIALGAAHARGVERLQVAEIASAENIPEKFLEQIFNQLREADFVVGVRGRKGGYRLSRPADRMSLGKIIRHIEGPLAPVSCASHTAYEPCSCPDEENCGLRMLMLDVRNAISDILDRYTLGSVVHVAMKRAGQRGPESGRRRVRASASKTGASPVPDGLLANLLPDYFI